MKQAEQMGKRTGAREAAAGPRRTSRYPAAMEVRGERPQRIANGSVAVPAPSHRLFHYFMAFT